LVIKLNYEAPVERCHRSIPWLAIGIILLIGAPLSWGVLNFFWPEGFYSQDDGVADWTWIPLSLALLALLCLLLALVGYVWARISD
jgi:hypothetical protein